MEGMWPVLKFTAKMWGNNSWLLLWSLNRSTLEGRRPGIYSSWLDCQVQLSGYKDARHAVFKCRDLAEKAWFEYHRTGGSSTSNHTEEKGSGYLIQVCMQELLLDTTKKFRIPPPQYTVQDKKIVDEQVLYRCYGSLQTNLIGKPPACLGQYAETEFEARESVALELLQRWSSSTGKRVKDFNYSYIELLEDENRRLDAENFDIIMENSRLKEELCKLRKIVEGLQ
ncbi:Ribosomal protein L9/RNase H1, N-terminal [Sesbania bispinosa]|nr:Ribosomal protein L9/RNase H1, N-terminal [Sesbania bispinosa]